MQGRDSVSAEDIQKAVQLVIIPRATTLNNPPEDDDDQQPPPPPPPPPPQDQQQARHGILLFVWCKGLCEARRWCLVHATQRCTKVRVPCNKYSGGHCPTVLLVSVHNATGM